MRRPRALVGTLLAIFLTTAAQLAAEPITFRFVALVDTSSGPVAELLGSSAAVGEAVTGTITIDPDVPDGAPSVDFFGAYESSGDAFGVRLDLDAHAASIDSVRTQILIGEGVSSLSFVSHGRRNDHDVSFEVTLREPVPGTLTDAIPRTAPRLDLFGEARFRFHGSPVGPEGEALPEQFARLSGNLLSLNDQAAPVPEPGTMLLVASGIAAVARLRRRRT